MSLVLSGDTPIRNSVKSEANQTNKPKTIKRKNHIPDEILHNAELNRLISILPSNYNFEIHKTIWRLKTEGVTLVALQFPEGLLMYSCIISDLIERFANCKTLIMGDVTYGACCIDDFTAVKLGAQFLVHYGHSCLVPISTTQIKVLYVFVEIYFDPSHLIHVIKNNFGGNPEFKLAIMGTIQFASVTHEVLNAVKDCLPLAFVPQEKPLSSGETLGCTSPVLPKCDALVFLADGRFHLESAMIRNPHVKAYRYDPYSKILSAEGYETDLMKNNRWKAIETARTATTWGVILGTLGRQGNPGIFNRIRGLLEAQGKRVVPFLMAELVPAKLRAIQHIDAWVQVACPRLSIDWGTEYDKPLLTSYELEVAVGSAPWLDVYPMDYYSSDGGSWSNGVHRLKI